MNMEKKSTLRMIVWSVKSYWTWRKNRHNKRDSNIWVFGEWYGEKCGDNCTSFANFVSENHKEHKLYWIAKKNADTSCLNPRIEVVEHSSHRAIDLLKKAGVVFVGQNYYDFTDSGFNYTSGAISVLLWHGVPWKKIGFDATKHSGRVHRAYQRFKSIFDGYTLFLSTSPNYDKVIKTAYMGEAERTIRAGLPRNEQLYDYTNIQRNKQEVVERISQLMGTRFGEKTTIITYMPTFRANTEEQQDMRELLSDEMFVNYLTNKDIVVIVKSHFAASDKLTCLNEGSNRICYLNDISAQKLLSASSLLITDYSSCFFDFLILDRPIIHFLYDYDRYKDEDRGLYYTKDQVTAGSEVFTRAELIEAIKTNVDNPLLFSERRKKRLNEFMTYESHENCEKIYQQIITKKKEYDSIL